MSALAAVLVAPLAAIVLHVANYNATAQIEHKTRCFTKILGANAVYYYAVYLVLSAAVRDAVIHSAIEASLPELQWIVLPVEIATIVGYGLFVVGILLNLWTLHALGIKGMYNGDSFGFLMDAPVTSGPYTIFSDPQYVGTTLAMFGAALRQQSIVGYALTLAMGIVFWISVKFIEGPHLQRLYSKKPSSSSKSAKRQ
ncbi:PEMT/PEM2 methyltransferase [Capsaspora owczarzaki ATCC 30864]|nr:PEMT/PEM2 methyltransferase [Capsaspora owczarzaki ATCC 30864]|eukprot:XP_004348088.2 PEMT/PEM2 methyltransferase [Capsaspora owczarzaki ATCC 30864]